MEDQDTYCRSLARSSRLCMSCSSFRARNGAQFSTCTRAASSFACISRSISAARNLNCLIFHASGKLCMTADPFKANLRPSRACICPAGHALSIAGEKSFGTSRCTRRVHLSTFTSVDGLEWWQSRSVPDLLKAGGYIYFESTLLHHAGLRDSAVHLLISNARRL